MTQRRFTTRSGLDPWSVRGLALDHPAMVGDRTLFPSTVVDVTKDAPDRLLVSGANNRKLGATIMKGAYAGYALYGLSLEERATCPISCDVRATCYGNGMQMARRHRIIDLDVFHDRLAIEIEHLLKQQDCRGLMVRLHVLGDFPSTEYVAMWADLLSDFPKLATYGYTHRIPSKRTTDGIGAAIHALKNRERDRFRIRWSSEIHNSDSARVIRVIPPGSRTEDGIVCPAQIKDDACCASCTLCWEPSARETNVVFVLHGQKSAASAAETAMAEIAAQQSVFSPELESGAEGATPRPHGVGRAVAQKAVEATIATVTTPFLQEREGISPLEPANQEQDDHPTLDPALPSPADETRRITPISIPSKFKPNDVVGDPPEMRTVSPLELLVEPSYQRDLSGRSVSLIRKIVTGWDWAKFKAPICAETREGLFVIDGQHTAIAAASHPGVLRIPVMVVGADKVEARAEAFVAHNRDRLAMSALQIFHAEVAAGGGEARSIMAAVKKVGAVVPRSVPLKQQLAPGQLIAISEARAVYRAHGAIWLERVLRIALLSQVQPIGTTVVRALKMLLSEQRFSDAARMSDAEIASALGSLSDVEGASRRYAAETGQGTYRACVMLIVEATKARRAA